MKKILAILICTIIMFGCSENEMARNFGGTETIELPVGRRLVNITWKGEKGAANLWVLTKEDTTKPTTYFFEEKSGFGVMEGKVIIKEQ